MKNIDKIRQKTADELAEMLSNLACNDCLVKDECDKYDNDTCFGTIRKWLEQEVEE